MVYEAMAFVWNRPRVCSRYLPVEFRHAMDAKNRVTIPSRWRRGEIEEFFAIPNLKGGFLMVMPPAEFTRLAEKVEHDQSLKPEERAKFLRQFSSEGPARDRR